MQSALIPFKLCMHNVRRLFTSVRALMGVLMGAFAIFCYGEQIRSMCQEYGVGASPIQVLICLCSYPFANCFLFVGWAIVICDAPFMYDTQLMIMLRSGRSMWCIGQMMYIFVAAICYWIVMTLLSCVLLLGYMGDFFTWGRVINTIARMYGWPCVPAKVVLSFTVEQAAVLTYALHIGVSVLLGMLIFAINIISKRTFGGVIALVFAFFELAFTGLGISSNYYYISPVSLCNLDVLDFNGSTYTPSDTYAYVFIAVGIALLAVINYIAVRHASMDVRADM